jgi:hypothetical protein
LLRTEIVYARQGCAPPIRQDVYLMSDTAQAAWWTPSLQCNTWCCVAQHADGRRCGQCALLQRAEVAGLLPSGVETVAAMATTCCAVLSSTRRTERHLRLPGVFWFLSVLPSRRCGWLFFSHHRIFTKLPFGLFLWFDLINQQNTNCLPFLHQPMGLNLSIFPVDFSADCSGQRARSPARRLSSVLAVWVWAAGSNRKTTV